MDKDQQHVLGASSTTSVIAQSSNCNYDERHSGAQTQGNMSSFGYNVVSREEQAHVQQLLERRPPRDLLSCRPGSNNSRVTYMAGHHALQLANKVFGYANWSSSIVRVDVDVMEQDPTTKKFHCLVSAIVQITLQNGAYHQDLGTGTQSGTSKVAVVEKAKKEAVTDAIKRTLRHFGALFNSVSDQQFGRDVWRGPAQASSPIRPFHVDPPTNVESASSELQEPCTSRHATLSDTNVYVPTNVNQSNSNGRIADEKNVERPIAASALPPPPSQYVPQANTEDWFTSSQVVSDLFAGIETQQQEAHQPHHPYPHQLPKEPKRTRYH